LCLVTAIAVGGALLLRARVPRHDLLNELIQASAAEPRSVEARLSGGFPWAPLQRMHAHARRDIAKTGVRLRGAASEVIGATATDRSLAARKAAASAYLLAGDARRAILTLTEVAAEANDTAVWSDLAAAHYAVALDESSPEQLELSLASADQALRLDPRSAEGLFNRALVLQRLGLRDLARTSWERYLAVDPASGWANEARANLRLLHPPVAFRDELEVAYAAAQREDLETIRKIVAKFPQDARKWGEVEILGRWAEAFCSEDAAAATLHLNLARKLGQALAQQNGEALLADAASAIDAADSVRKRALANAHATYRSGRKTYQTEEPGAAEPLLRDAARSFRDGRSPMQLAASYYAANTLFDQNRVDLAQHQLTDLQSRLPMQYHALRAQIQWELALCAISKAQWGRALALLHESTATFDRLGETDNASVVRCIIADSYENLGEVALARTERAQAMSRLGRVTNKDLQVALAGMTRTAIRERNWRVAGSLLNLEAASARQAGNRTLEVDALLRRTLVDVRLRNAAAAAEDLRLADEARREITDRALRERLEADHRFAEGVASSLSEAPEAIEKLTAAIDFHMGKGERVLLPQMLHARARARRTARDHSGAWADIERAIAELEGQRSSTPEGDVRAGILATSGEIFEEAVAMQIERGNPAAALQYSERGRARVLLDATAGSVDLLPSRSDQWAARMPRDVAAVSYTPVRDELHIFVVDDSGVSHMRVATPVAQLRRLATSFFSAAVNNDRDDMHRTGGELYSAILAPIGDRLRRSQEVVFTGDSELLGVPFAALRDPKTKRYAIEDFGIVVSPSIAAYLRFAKRSQDFAVSENRRLLAIADPATGDGGERLRASLREVGAVVPLYDQATVLSGASATREAFARGLGAADVVHFAGHAQAGRRDLEASILLARHEGDSGALYASELQKIEMPRVSLAILAACETGQSARRDNEGTWSIARSFLVAGVPSVVATLWPIDDETAPRFFLRLHQHLLSGLSPAAAVRATQLEFLREKPDSRPSIWTAIQVIGS
jgi:CHAT domain-containing protein